MLYKTELWRVRSRRAIQIYYYNLNFPTSIVGLMLDFLSKITAINGVLTLKQHLIFGIIRLRHPITSIEEVLIL